MYCKGASIYDIRNLTYYVCFSMTPPRVQTSYMDVKNAYGNPGSAPYSLLVIVTLHTFMI